MLGAAIICLWFVLPVVACVAALVVDRPRFTAFVHLYLLVNYSVLAVLAFGLVLV